MPLIDLIAGARPNFVKIAAIAAALDRHRAQGGHLRYRLVHTGQHYDYALSQSFFRDLNIPAADVILGGGTGTPAQQTGAIMTGYEALLSERPPDCCLVVGDVTSTIACALTARRSGVPVAHVEAGIRCGDWTMPEENNRLATDAITNWFFTTSEHAGCSLSRQGVAADRIHFVGNTMIDTLLANRHRFARPAIWNELGLQKNRYILLTLHRPANVDDKQTFQDLLESISRCAKGHPVIFPLHPRARKALNQLETLPPWIHPVAPQPYLSFNYLLSHAKTVVTDSGGVTEEATVLGIPCMTLRPSTERPETVTFGTNEIIGSDPSRHAFAFDRLFAGGWKRGTIPPKWDGQAGKRIIDVLAKLLPAA